MKKLLITLLVMLIPTLCFAKGSWHVTRTYKNVVPLSVTVDGDCIQFFFNEGNSYRKYMKHFPKGSLTDMRINEAGSMMHYLDENGDWDEKFKWFPSDKKKPLPKKIEKKTPVKKVVKVETRWTDANIKLPKMYEVVLIKYKKGILATAYINEAGEWKLNTDRDKLFGGDTIKNVGQWRIID